MGAFYGSEKAWEQVRRFALEAALTGFKRGKRGKKVGIAYELENGEIIYVPGLVQPMIKVESIVVKCLPGASRDGYLSLFIFGLYSVPNQYSINFLVDSESDS